MRLCGVREEEVAHGDIADVDGVGRGTITENHQTPIYHDPNVVVSNLTSDGIDASSCGFPVDDHHLIVEFVLGDPHPTDVDLVLCVPVHDGVAVAEDEGVFCDVCCGSSYD